MSSLHEHRIFEYFVFQVFSLSFITILDKCLGHDGKLGLRLLHAFLSYTYFSNFEMSSSTENFKDTINILSGLFKAPFLAKPSAMSFHFIPL